MDERTPYFERRNREMDLEQETDTYDQSCDSCRFYQYDDEKSHFFCGNVSSEAYRKIPRGHWCWAWKKQTKAQRRWNQEEGL